MRQNPLFSSSLFLLLFEIYFFPWNKHPIGKARTPRYHLAQAHRMGWHECLAHLSSADEEKTVFITPHGLYCYKVMSFRLKNADATYQRLMTKIFKPQVGCKKNSCSSPRITSVNEWKLKHILTSMTKMSPNSYGKTSSAALESPNPL